MSSDESSLPPPPPAQPPTAFHHDDADEEDDTVKQLGDCSLIYLTLQNCLIKTDRNWKSCQPEVQNLKVCNEKRMRGRK